MSGGQVVGAKTRIPRITGVARERIDHRLAGLWDHRLGLVVAPAGSGKTTLLAQFAVASGVPVGWWRAEASDATETAAVAHLERALVPVLEGVVGGWDSIDDVAEALDGWNGQRALIAIDDLHALWGTEAEAALERLVTLLPAGIVVLAATRRLPGFNLTRMLISGDLLEIGQEDLRFRAWEVEHLFRDFYGSPMPPDELAELARRTGGWAAGLQLFHLATRGKPPAERRRMLAQLGVRSRLLREYLARNVLDELPVHVRDFLVRTCVLGRLTAALCDELTGGTSSGAVLAELEQRQIFTAALDDEGSYRYHEVLRSHLEGVLVEQVGESAARERFAEAGALLERHGFHAEALRAYGRAEAWDALTRLLGGRPEELVDRPGDWLDALPNALVDHDPWLLLGTARRLTSQGRADEAIDAYRRAEAASGAASPVDICRRERQAISTWLGAAPLVPADWLAALRLATARAPKAVADHATRSFPGAEGRLVAGMAQLLAGSLDDAERHLDAASIDPAASAVVATAAAIGAAAARAFGGQSVVAELDRCCEQAEEAGLPWLAAVARAVALLDGERPSDVGAGGLPKSDPWGAAIVQLLAGIGEIRRRSGELDAAAALADASDGFRALDAPVLTAWATSALAVASPGSVTQREAQQAVRAVGVDALPIIGATTATTATKPTEGRLALRCFGIFELSVDGAPVDLGAIKPRVRSLVRFLALHAGQGVHRERVIESLWPDEGDLRTGLRNLQVAISSLRQLVEPGVARGEATLVVRDGDMYRLAVSSPDECDLLGFRAACAAGRSARAAGDVAAARDAFATAVSLYRGDLLSDEGAAEWVADERERCRLDAADAALAAADLALEAGDLASAVEACSTGLRIDPYRDGLWRTLIKANELAGDVAAARRAEERYAEVLKELGLS
ncbi:MAG TPA: BTAD domain-containing putative transcriptional regulator [Acidimicrobiales bacterium]|nr:BTAD domain-containing putative transcriptional regulator [Acidimicrobiales bacterium]